MFDTIREMGRDIKTAVELLRQVNDNLVRVADVLIVGFSAVLVMAVVLAVVRRS